MQEVNYIHHLNEVLERFAKDKRLNPPHVSLYMALFRFWNLYYFKPSFYIQREEVMALSKIGAKTTYHRCLKDLSNWSYILYEPSFNPFKGSRVHMFDFEILDEVSNRPKSETACEQVVDSYHPKSGTACGQLVGRKDKQYQTKKNNTNKHKPEIFKDQKKWNADEKKNKPEGTVPYTDNLKTQTQKNYDEPL